MEDGSSVDYSVHSFKGSEDESHCVLNGCFTDELVLRFYSFLVRFHEFGVYHYEQKGEESEVQDEVKEIDAEYSD